MTEIAEILNQNTCSKISIHQQKGKMSQIKMESTAPKIDNAAVNQYEEDDEDEDSDDVSMTPPIGQSDLNSMWKNLDDMFKQMLRTSANQGKWTDFSTYAKQLGFKQGYRRPLYETLRADYFQRHKDFQKQQLASISHRSSPKALAGGTWPVNRRQFALNTQRKQKGPQQLRTVNMAPFAPVMLVTSQAFYGKETKKPNQENRAKSVDSELASTML